MLNEPPPQNQARIETVRVTRAETDGRFTRLSFHAPEQGRRALAGQFFEVTCHPADEANPTQGPPLSPLLNRPFSINRWIEDGFSILFEMIGPGTKRLGAAKQGDRITVLGPLGRGLAEIPPHVQHLVLVAGGIGIAAFTTFAQLARQRGVACSLYYGVNRGTDLALRNPKKKGYQSRLLDEFDSLGCRCALSSMLDGSFFPGTVVDLLERDRQENCVPFGDPVEGIFMFGCGPWAMMNALARWAMPHQIPCFLLMEEMMGCGLGICRSCIVPGYDIREDGSKVPRNIAVCREGPLIAAERIDWERKWE
ncbi:MAG TPA: hypothetical protein PLZ55_12830 [bacterium]|nr:hypothetical protein [bacterium]